MRMELEQHPPSGTGAPKCTGRLLGQCSRFATKSFSSGSIQTTKHKTRRRLRALSSKPKLECCFAPHPSQCKAKSTPFGPGSACWSSSIRKTVTKNIASQRTSPAWKWRGGRRSSRQRSPGGGGSGKIRRRRRRDRECAHMRVRGPVKDRFRP
jgi:hypothetical protein